MSGEEGVCLNVCTTLREAERTAAGNTRAKKDGSVEQHPTRLAHGPSVRAELGVAVWGLSQ